MIKLTLTFRIAGIILLLFAFYPRVLFSQDNMQEKQAKLFELILYLQQNNNEFLKANNKNDIDQIKTQIDHAINNLSLLLGADDSMIKIFKSDTEATYNAAIKMTPEIREKNANILNNFDLNQSIAQEQLLSKYPDSGTMLMLWKYYNQSLHAMTPIEVDFLNALFMSEIIHVYRILGMQDEYTEYLKKWRLAITSASGELNSYFDQVILSHEVNNELTGNYTLEQVVPKLQLLISELEKYEQFEFYRNGKIILQCQLALAYLGKEKVREGGKIILQVRHVFDDFNPLSQSENTPARLLACYLVSKLLQNVKTC